MSQKKHKSGSWGNWMRYAVLSLGLIAVVKLSTISAKAIEAGWYDIRKSNISIDENGVHRFEDGSLVQDAFLFDGVYTYFIQSNGTAMKDRLTYHPDGEHVIYFDQNGHEVFDNFAHITMSIAGTPVDDTCYFNTFGYLYVDETTFVTNADGTQTAYYMNGQGLLQLGGWFQYANGRDIGYADPTTGALMYNQWGYNEAGQAVYFMADGKLARGDIFDGCQTHVLDLQDGHLITSFPGGSVEYKTVMVSSKETDNLGNAKTTEWKYGLDGRQYTAQQYNEIEAKVLYGISFSNKIPVNVVLDEYSRVASYDAYDYSGTYYFSCYFTYGDHRETMRLTNGGDTWRDYVATWNDQEFHVVGTDQDGKVVYDERRVYDAAGNVIYEEIDNPAKYWGGQHVVTEYQYDAQNRMIQKHNRVYRYLFDSYGDDMYEEQFNWEYNANGDCVMHKRPYYTYYYEYDDQFRLLKETEVYDGNTASANTCTYQYNEKGLLLKKSRASAGEEYEVYSYVYNEKDQLIRETDYYKYNDAICETEYTYDDQGRKATEHFKRYEKDGSVLESEYEIAFGYLNGTRIETKDFFDVSSSDPDIDNRRTARKIYYYDQNDNLIKLESGSLYHGKHYINETSEYQYETIPILENPRKFKIDYYSYDQ